MGSCLSSLLAVSLPNYASKISISESVGVLPLTVQCGGSPPINLTTNWQPCMPLANSSPSISSVQFEPTSIVP